MKDEVQSLLGRARVNLDAAETLLQNHFAGIAASRVYYAMFYAACAILRKEGLEFTSHAAVHGSFGRLFAKTGKIDPQYHRYLIDALATQVWEIDKDEATLKVFRGTYSEYHTRKEAGGVPESVGEDSGPTKGEAFRKARAAKNRELARERRRRARLTQVEGRISALEEELTSLGRQLANPPTNRAEVHRLAEEYMRAESELEVTLEEWEGLQR